MALQSYEKKKGLSTEDVPIVNQTQNVDVGAGAVRGIALDDVAGIEIDTDKVMDPKALDFERFMAEDIVVHMNDAPDEHAHQFVEVTVNGDHRVARCGEEVVLKRYHLGVLAQAKTMRIVQKAVTLPDGSKGFEEKGVLKQQYGFQVMHDPSGRRGMDWLRQKMASPA